MSRGPDFHNHWRFAVIVGTPQIDFATDCLGRRLGFNNDRACSFRYGKLDSADRVWRNKQYRECHFCSIDYDGRRSQFE